MLLPLTLDNDFAFNTRLTKFFIGMIGMQTNPKYHYQGNRSGDKAKYTKNMRKNSTRDAPSILESQQIEDIDKFIYDRIVVRRTGGSENESKIIKSRHAYNTLRVIWNNKNIHTKTKLQLFNCNIKTILLYGSVTWKQTKNLVQNLYCMSAEIMHNTQARTDNQSIALENCKTEYSIHHHQRTAS